MDMRAAGTLAAVMSPGEIGRFRQGDPDALRALYREYAGLVNAVTARLLRSRDLTDEAAQLTFVNAWKAADRFDPTRDPAPWLATIARRAAIDVHRRETRRAASSLEEVGPGDQAVVTLPEDIDRAEAAWTVRAAVDALPADKREVVRLTHLEGMTHQEAAVHLGVPLGTVKSRSHRAHQHLARTLGHLREDAR